MNKPPTLAPLQMPSVPKDEIIEELSVTTAPIRRALLILESTDGLTFFRHWKCDAKALAMMALEVQESALAAREMISREEDP